MNNEIQISLILSGCFLLLFAVAEVLYHLFKIKVEITRKVVHVGTGILTFLFPVYLTSHWYVLALCASFALILILSQKYNLLKSVNAIDRNSVGSIAYPISVYGCFLAFEFSGMRYEYFFIPILVLAVCDPIAALTGKRWPLGKYKAGKEYKTMLGSAAFFISALIILMIGFDIVDRNEFQSGRMIAECIIMALGATITEAFSRNGYDNIIIPAVCLSLMYIADYVN